MASSAPNEGRDRSSAACDVCGQPVCRCTSGPSFFRRLAEEAQTDPMVPKGYVEIRDGAGKLLSRHKIGDADV